MKTAMKRSLAWLLTAVLLMGCMMLPAAAEVVVKDKYGLTVKELNVQNNGLDKDGNPYKASTNSSDQYMYYNPASTVDGAPFTVSFTYDLPAGSYKVTAVYKSRDNGATQVDFLCDGEVLATRSMQSSAVAEHTDVLGVLTIEETGTHTFAWQISGGSNVFLTVGNVYLVAYDPNNVNSFRFESEDTPFVAVDSKGVSATESKQSDWAWNLALSTSGITGNLSNNLAYFANGGIGGYIEYTLPVTEGWKPGEYALYWNYRPNSQTYSTLAFAFNGQHIMDVSQKSKDVVCGLMNSANVMLRIPLGTVTVKADGTDTVRLTMISAEGAPTQGFTSDYFELVSPDWAPSDSDAQTLTVPDTDTDLVDVYPLYSMYEQSTTYKLTADGVSVPVVEYMSVYDYAAFSLKKDEPIEITVEYTENITSYTVSPQKDNIPAKVEGKKLTITLDKPTYLIFDINGNKKRLVVAVDEPETNVPDPTADGVFNVLDYGADPTAVKLSTKAIQAAMADAAEYGAAEGNDQGVVYVPDGVYSVSNIELLSNTNLYISGGAVLRMADDDTCYKPMAQKTSLEGKYMTSMLYTVEHGENISVTGRGTLDGRGARNRGLGWVVDMLITRSVDNFLLDGPLFRESGMWAIVPAWSNHVLMQNFKVFNNTSYNEDDGVDVVGGSDILVRHSIAITNDDAYSTKTYIVNEGASTPIFGQGPATEMNGVVFEDCTAWTHCYAFKCGQGIGMEQKDLIVRNTTIYDCGVGFGVHHHQNGDTTPHDVNGMLYENIDIEHINYNIWGKSCFANFIMDTPTGHKAGGHILNATIRNINVRDRGSSGSKLQGSTWQGVDWMVSNITFENVVMEGVLATSLTELGFKGKNSDTYFSNPGKEFVNNMSGCYVINPANALIPAQYYYSGENVSVAEDAAAQTGKVLTTTGETTLRYMAIDFGDKAEALNVRYKAAAGEATVAIGTPDNVVGTLALEASGDYSVAALPVDAITGGQDIYITLPAGVTLDYLQPYTDVTEQPPVPEYTPGDVDKSGSVDVADIMKLKALIMADKWTEEELSIGDLDRSGKLDVGDIMAVKNIIMSK